MTQAQQEVPSLSFATKTNSQNGAACYLLANSKDFLSKTPLVAGGNLLATKALEKLTDLLIYHFKNKQEVTPMKLLSPQQVAEITGLPYAKALLIIKSTNHIQINNRYYVSESTLRAFLNPDAPMLIEEDEK